mmetsp:Transcript_39147/g.61962  ORF Transcript_39147/g.61962 Transcript_39147/m.61962 type:complete len:413 (-) Transcript_39147:1593-2831(-)
MDETSTWEVLASESEGDSLRPSWIEMIAQQQLMQLLRPAMAWVLEVLAVRTSEWEGGGWLPQMAGLLLKYNNEAFHLWWGMLEHHHLLHYKSSFSESFYGFHRRSIVPNSNPPRYTEMSTSTRWISLFMLVGVPYLKTKLDDYYRAQTQGEGGVIQVGRVDLSEIEEDESEGRRVEGGNFVEEMKARWNKMWRRCVLLFFYLNKKFPFVKWYPYFHAFYEGLFFVYQLAYLYQNTRFYSPDVHIQGIAVQRTTQKFLDSLKREQEQRNLANWMYAAESPAPMRWIRIINYLIGSTYRGIMNSARVTLPLSVFFIQFLRWWYSNERNVTRNEEPAPIPPPPSCPPSGNDSVGLPSNKTLCPLCRGPRTNPAVSVSGFAFCYPCLFDHVEARSQCPITNLPMDTSSIRRIYEAS